ncbi:MATH domain and coiled-coil domain-containing protein At3g58270-like [Vigna radiata var. radiata]|uniref:MATH domain and coiled-coil domain-containing protein At3g58270-like n=1 Tax=Vigna radiata var. radiata TaxID=3916 RepID=A0A1S3UZI7_VIGRR|nr:MATH domain and coiled-coil domain-containing protein At3g58270-like [Vigna radiata var. radiata]
MKNQNTKDKVFQMFTWTLTNFPSYVCQKEYLKTFTVDGYTWGIRIIRAATEKLYLSIILDSVSGWPPGCGKFANLKFILINQLNPTRNIIKGISHTTFNPRNDHSRAIYASADGFIVNDICIVELHISVYKSDHEKQGESLRNIDNKLVQNTEENFSTKKMISNSPGEVVDFRGIGKVEKDFIPLLEEVCSRYPSLIDSKKKNSKKFTEWAFTALGRVLYFLNIKKVRDMDDDACNHLQTLWEELEICGFDLSWLKPHVQSALDMKTCVEKVFNVKRWEENVITLENDVAVLEKEIKNLTTKMIEAKVNLEITRRDLVQAKEGFEECDLDAQLTYMVNHNS